MKYSIENLSRELGVSPSELASFCNNNSITGIKKTSTISEDLYNNIKKLFKNDIVKTVSVRSSSQKKADIKFDEGHILTNIDNKFVEKRKDELNDILNQYCQCYGYEIIWCDFINVAIPKYHIIGQKEVLEKFNMVEKAIFELLDKNVLDITNINSISDFLELNKLITKYYVDDFLKNGMIKYISTNNNSIDFTPAGKTAFQDGYKLHQINQIDIILAYNDFYYSIISANDTYIPNLDYRYIVINENNNFIPEENEIIDSLKKHKIFDKKASYSISQISSNGLYLLPCVIIYLYDFLNKESIRLLYNFDDKLIVTGNIADTIIKKDADIVLSDDRYTKRLNDIETLISIEHEQTFINDIYTDKRQKQENSISIERYYDSILIRQKFLECFASAQNSVIIQCPWIKDGAIDGTLISAIQEAINRGVFVFIQYGIDSDIMRESSNNQSIEKLCSLVDDNNVRRVFVVWTGNNHTKEIVVDKKLDLFGSFNFLSFNPNIIYFDNNIVREEGMEVIEDQGIANQSWKKYISNLENYYLSNFNEHTLSGAFALYSLTKSKKIMSTIINYSQWCIAGNDCYEIAKYITDYDINSEELHKIVLTKIYESKDNIVPEKCKKFIDLCMKNKSLKNTASGLRIGTAQ